MSQRSSWGRPRPLARALPKILSPALRRQGFARTEVVARWCEIVGPGLARLCAPERLRFARGARGDGTLTLRCLPAAAPEIQHLAPLIVERINGYYGFRAVARLQLVQGPLPQPTPRRPAPPPLPEAERAALARTVAAVDEERLRAALLRLGESVRARAATRS